MQINQLASAKQIECLQKIPRYPPFMEGLPVRSPRELLASQLQLAGSIQHPAPDRRGGAAGNVLQPGGITPCLFCPSFTSAASVSFHLLQLIPMSHSTALNFSNLT
ncbi:MAG: hypothetical protein PHQ73_11070, partial [Gallionella sp.]|nr:hypothetical protein [Gallionella sp.]